jgi:uncharacterized protein
VWHLYEGGPIQLIVGPPGLERIERHRLGPVAADAAPVVTVPAGWWQTAFPMDGYALAGCTVGPGFAFEDFTFLREDPAARRTLEAHGDEFSRFL